MQEIRDLQEEYIFALDIGTRSVIGIVGKLENGLFNVLDMEKVEHSTRAMFDGQIEDIDEVAKVAQQVKTALEQRLCVKLSQVCVAAAGRTLQTSRAGFELELISDSPVDKQLLYQLEMGAIDSAQAQVDRTRSKEEVTLCCVGYSVLRYYLDEYPMTTILGHKGRKAGVEIIATFLPVQVVDSLKAAMSLIDLQISHLTLEPIAAMNAVIPTELRLLNLALVDIGAGTSDIAISSKGSVAAYTMATVAGDEITEAIMRQYLVDFQTAEQMKLALSGGIDPIEYTDVLGFAYSIGAQELTEVIRPGVTQLAQVISEKIIECNQTAPAAVFLVGGGSKVLMLCDAVASALEIDRKKVAVGGNNYMKKQTSTSLDLSDPEFATPLGIALTAASSNRLHAFHVLVNDKKVQLLQDSQMTVMNALLLSGYKYSDLMGKSGKSIAYQLNGVRKVARGGLPSPAGITVNGKAASLATPINSGDSIVITPSISGSEARVFVRELLAYPKGRTVVCDTKQYQFPAVVTVNGMKVDIEQEIFENDAVTVHEDVSLRALLRMAEKDFADTVAFVNGKQAEESLVLSDGDIVITQKRVQKLEQSDAAKQTAGTITVTLNRHEVELPPKPEGTQYIFLDMLNFVDIDPSKPEGDILLKLNGKNASYLDVIGNGDSIQISWTKR